MLRKRTRSHQKDHQMGSLAMPDSGSETCYQPDCPGFNHKTSSLFNAPGLFVGLSPKGLSDCDSVRSPTSPLEFRIFSTLGNPSRSPMSTHNGCQKSWDCSKVGLSIVESLDDMKRSDKILRSSESKNILFGSGVRIKTPSFRDHNNSFEAPKSLPRNFAISPHTYTKSPLQKGNSDVLFEIGGASFNSVPFGKTRSCSLDSCRSFSSLSHLADRKSKLNSVKFNPDDDITTQVDCPQLLGGSPNSSNYLHTNLTLTSISNGSGTCVIGSLSASEIELSEDYTCVITHGPNPKKTHIYGDMILECPANDSTNFVKDEGKEFVLPQAASTPAIPNPFPSNDFLSFCCYCNKKLDEGKDIYIYRGEKAFCSLACRAQEIMIDEALEKSTNISSEDAPSSDNSGLVFETGIMDSL
ncbi:hypothetical protein Tsubulata_031784 [Turnera subulata]|uniref:FLZ-type domain-containing protein n=1 Tax=Turnera subulata TaxID=218843 RepID=A0A9Q0FUR0_9ROSI|nr:hypothetical protein Tsubulata_031784 [Turnera subulata]